MVSSFGGKIQNKHIIVMEMKAETPEMNIALFFFFQENRIRNEREVSNHATPKTCHWYSSSGPVDWYTQTALGRSPLGDNTELGTQASDGGVCIYVNTV